MDTSNKTINNIYSHFENIATNYPKYRKKNRYYWSSTSDYINYYLLGHESIVQLGCGTGETINDLKGSHKMGVDFSPSMIQQAKEQFPEIEFIIGDIQYIDIQKQFDVIIISNTIGFVHNVQDMLMNIQKLCHSKTRIFIHNYSRLWQPLIKLSELLKIKKRAPEQNWLGKKDIENLLYLSGYEVYRTNRRIIIPYYIPIISTLFNRYLAKLPLINNLCLSQDLIARLPHIKSEEAPHYSVSVIIPARNESGNIRDAIERLPDMGSSTEMIFIEGNSTDDTWQQIQTLSEEYKNVKKIKIGRQPGKGKYDAVKVGFDMAEGDILMILDADLTVMPEELPKFYNALRTRMAEFINGSRLVYPMEEKAMRFLNILGNKFFSYVFSWLLEQPIKDTLCGTKVLFRKDYDLLVKNRKYFGDFDPFGDFDLLFGAYKLNLKIIDLPIRYQERSYGDTNISRFRHGLILLKMVAFASNRIKFI